MNLNLFERALRSYHKIVYGSNNVAAFRGILCVQCHTFLKECYTSSKDMLRALQENVLETTHHFLKGKAQKEVHFLETLGLL